MTRYIDLLEASDLRNLGIPEPWHLGRADRVRFHELDALNHVNNATYVTYLEIFRLSYLLRHKIAYHAPDAPVLVIKSLGVDYFKPLVLDQDYVITGRVTKFRNTSFTMEYAIFADGLAATGYAVHVLFEADGVTRHSVPDRVRQIWLTEDGATAES